jgi:hypothetical protein
LQESDAGLLQGRLLSRDAPQTRQLGRLGEAYLLAELEIRVFDRVFDVVEDSILSQ